MEKIHQAVTEIWIPQVWQPPARPDRDDNTLQPGGLRGKNDHIFNLHITLHMWNLQHKILSKMLAQNTAILLCSTDAT